MPLSYKDVVDYSGGSEINKGSNPFQDISSDWRTRARPWLQQNPFGTEGAVSAGYSGLISGLTAGNIRPEINADTPLERVSQQLGDVFGMLSTTKGLGALGHVGRAARTVHTASALRKIVQVPLVSAALYGLIRDTGQSVGTNEDSMARIKNAASFAATVAILNKAGTMSEKHVTGMLTKVLPALKDNPALAKIASDVIFNIPVGAGFGAMDSQPGHRLEGAAVGAAGFTLGTLPFHIAGYRTMKKNIDIQEQVGIQSYMQERMRASTAKTPDIAKSNIELQVKIKEAMAKQSSPGQDPTIVKGTTDTTQAKAKKGMVVDPLRKRFDAILAAKNPETGGPLVENKKYAEELWVKLKTPENRGKLLRQLDQDGVVAFHRMQEVTSLVNPESQLAAIVNQAERQFNAKANRLQGKAEKARLFNLLGEQKPMREHVKVQIREAIDTGMNMAELKEVLKENAGVKTLLDKDLNLMIKEVNARKMLEKTSVKEKRLPQPTSAISKQWETHSSYKTRELADAAALKLGAPYIVKELKNVAVPGKAITVEGVPGAGGVLGPKIKTGVTHETRYEVGQDVQRTISLVKGKKEGISDQERAGNKTNKEQEKALEIAYKSQLDEAGRVKITEYQKENRDLLSLIKAKREAVEQVQGVETQEGVKRTTQIMQIGDQTVSVPITYYTPQNNRSGDIPNKSTNTLAYIPGIKDAFGMPAYGSYHDAGNFAIDSGVNVFVELNPARVNESFENPRALNILFKPTGRSTKWPGNVTAPKYQISNASDVMNNLPGKAITNVWYTEQAEPKELNKLLNLVAQSYEDVRKGTRELPIKLGKFSRGTVREYSSNWNIDDQIASDNHLKALREKAYVSSFIYKGDNDPYSSRAIEIRNENITTAVKLIKGREPGRMTWGELIESIDNTPGLKTDLTFSAFKNSDLGRMLKDSVKVGTPIGPDNFIGQTNSTRMLQGDKVHVQVPGPVVRPITDLKEVQRMMKYKEDLQLGHISSMIERVIKDNVSKHRYDDPRVDVTDFPPVYGELMRRVGLWNKHEGKVIIEALKYISGKHPLEMKTVIDRADRNPIFEEFSKLIEEANQEIHDANKKGDFTQAMYNKLRVGLLEKIYHLRETQANLRSNEFFDEVSLRHLLDSEGNRNFTYKGLVAVFSEARGEGLDALNSINKMFDVKTVADSAELNSLLFNKNTRNLTLLRYNAKSIKEMKKIQAQILKADSKDIPELRSRLQAITDKLKYAYTYKTESGKEFRIQEKSHFDYPEELKVIQTRIGKLDPKDSQMFKLKKQEKALKDVLGWDALENKRSEISQSIKRSERILELLSKHAVIETDPSKFDTMRDMFFYKTAYKKRQGKDYDADLSEFFSGPKSNWLRSDKDIGERGTRKRPIKSVGSAGEELVPNNMNTKGRDISVKDILGNEHIINSSKEKLKISVVTENANGSVSVVVHDGKPIDLAPEYYDIVEAYAERPFKQDIAGFKPNSVEWPTELKSLLGARNDRIQNQDYSEKNKIKIIEKYKHVSDYLKQGLHDALHAQVTMEGKVLEDCKPLSAEWKKIAARDGFDPKSPKWLLAMEEYYLKDPNNISSYELSNVGIEKALKGQRLALEDFSPEARAFMNKQKSTNNFAGQEIDDRGMFDKKGAWFQTNKERGYAHIVHTRDGYVMGADMIRERFMTSPLRGKKGTVQDSIDVANRHGTPLVTDPGAVMAHYLISMSRSIKIDTLTRILENGIAPSGLPLVVYPAKLPQYGVTSDQLNMYYEPLSSGREQKLDMFRRRIGNQSGQDLYILKDSANIKPSNVDTNKPGDLKRWMRSMYSTEGKLSIPPAFGKTKSLVKMWTLANPAFSTWQAINSFLPWIGPKGIANAMMKKMGFSDYSSWEHLTFEAAKHGYQLNPQQMLRTITDDFGFLGQDVQNPIIKGVFDQWGLRKRAFEFIDRGGLLAWENIRARNIRAGMDPKQAGYKAAEVVNDIGGVPDRMVYSGFTGDMMRYSWLAGYNMTTVFRQAAGMFGGVPKGFKGEQMLGLHGTPAEIKIMAGQYRKQLAFQLFGFALTAGLYTKMTSGIFPWERENKQNWFKAGTGIKDSSGNEILVTLPIFKDVRDLFELQSPRQFVVNKMDPTLKTIIEFLTLHQMLPGGMKPMVEPGTPVLEGITEVALKKLAQMTPLAQLTPLRQYSELYPKPYSEAVSGVAGFRTSRGMGGIGEKANEVFRLRQAEQEQARIYKDFTEDMKRAWVDGDKEAVVRIARKRAKNPQGFKQALKLFMLKHQTPDKYYQKRKDRVPAYLANKYGLND